jgi:transposase
MATTNSPFQRRYPPEMRERAVRMVREAIVESGERVGAVTRVARQLGIGPESLRNWVKQAEIDSGKRPGVTTAEQQRIAELEREVRELRRANEMADSTGGRNESCEMSEKAHRRREVDARTAWSPERGAEAVGLPTAITRLAPGRHRSGDWLHGTDGRPDGARGEASRRETAGMAATAGVPVDQGT